MSTTWKSQSGFVWALIGSAVGFANVLSFSAKAYKNGGGAYLIPYAVALFVIGIPFLLLEGKIGNRWKSPLVASYGYVWGKMGKMLGWLSVLACLTIGAFYIVLTGYSVAYTYFSAADQIPQDTKTFFLQSVLQITPNVGEFGSFSKSIFIATAAVGLLSWVILRRPVRDGIERICSFFMPLMVLIMTAFAIAVCLLPGGMQGWVYYLKPNFHKLLDIELWRDVFGQLFFSLSLGLGIIVGYSRHTGETANIPRAMLYVALGDFFVSFVSGAAIFGCLAHISHTQGIPFDQILTSDSTFEIGFILFPKILKVFGPLLAQGIGTIFFFCVFIAGITGVFSIVESIAGNVEVEFQTTRKKAVAASLALMLFMAIFFCMGNASHLIDALVPMVIGINMLISGLALVFAFAYRNTLLPLESGFYRF
ncbi:MAG TPA: sodium-dependent transporter, partial [Chlamydiales bacterium]|nr:sodium-dependent transporter [Chlamydiales bacterium]